MKLNKVIALCKKTKMVVVYNWRGNDGEIKEQWIGDGAACYRADGLPILDELGVAAIFDIPAKDADKWKILVRELPPAYDFTCDGEKNGETIFEEDPIFLNYGGVMLKPLRNPGSAPLFIDVRYLTPFIDEMEHLYLYRRTAENGQDYAAVKVGMFLAGIIAPRKIESEPFVDCVKTLASELEKTLAAENAEAQDG